MKCLTFDNLSPNSEIQSLINLPKRDLVANIICASFYTLFADDKIIFYGPERCPEGYARVSKICIPKGTTTLKIKILYYGVPTFDLDEQPLFFGLEILEKNRVIVDTNNLSFYKNKCYVSPSIKYSFQRGFMERYDLTSQTLEPLKTKEIECPILLEANEIKCSYQEAKTSLIKSGNFIGFKKIDSRKYLDITKEYNQYDFDNDFFKRTKKNYRYKLFKLDGEKSGLIKLNINSQEENEKAYLYFDECLVEDGLMFGRGGFTNIIEINLNKGQNEIISNIVYNAQYMMVIYKGNVDILPSMILVENENAKDIKPTGNEDIDLVLAASRNTYMQNSYDIYTDCPGRERAGWLCDSYFIGIGERYFANNNKIEKHFLENFIIGKCPEINNDEMVPMCFPSTHIDGTYIPNWALWFILEIDRYYQETKDQEMLTKAKDRIMGIISFFNKYENEIGLLENLPSWVFIEWSEAGSPEYVKGISFPTNMAYAFTLERISELYSIPSYHDKSLRITHLINEMSFDGEYYHDNASRSENGQIIIIKDHISETAQYYAIFFNINKDDSFINKMINNFSATKTINENNMPKSNVFIGNFLRFMILIRKQKYQQFLDEAIPYFAKMAKVTQTLWEKDTNDASCNHGLNAALAPLIEASLFKINN